MRYMLIALLLVIMPQSIWGQHTIYGRVTDKNNWGIPYAVVQLKGTDKGAYCNEAGVFTLEGGSAGLLIAYCMGYEHKEVPLANRANDSLIIMLKETSNLLQEVAVTAKKGRVHEGILGKEKLKYYGPLYGKIGFESAMYLEADRPERNGTLKEVYIYITDLGIPDAKFRLHVYEKNTRMRLPNADLTDSNVVVHATTGNEWVKVDLGNKHIPIKEGIFIAIEWIPGYGNSLKPQAMGQNGQVVGLTWSYGKTSLSYARGIFTGDWEQYGWGLNPMIYCTYSY